MNTPPRVYIAGPMSGWPRFNFPAFHDAEEHLRLLGYDVFNPAHNGACPGQPWEYYMRLDLHMVANADAVCLLPEWEASRGARLEVTVAHALGMKTIPLSRWTRTTLAVAA